MLNRPINYKYLIFSTAPFAAFFIGYLVTMLCLSTKKTTIPNLLGKNVHEALKTASESGFATKILTTVVAHNLANGTVITQIPTPGSTAKTNSIIFLQLSEQNQLKKVPQLIGSSTATIEDILNTAEVPFKLIKLGHLSPQNHCFAQYPSAGQKKLHEHATAYISQSCKKQFLMPNIVGTPLEQAKEALESQGIILECDTTQNQQSQETVIIQQRPLPGSVIKLSDNTIIRVHVLKKET